MGVTFVYRIFDAEESLLYVGLTTNMRRRILNHRRTAPWWHEVATVTRQSYPDLQSARLGEVLAIHDEHPAYNRDRRFNADQRRRHDLIVTSRFRAPGAPVSWPLPVSRSATPRRRRSTDS